MVKKAYIEPGRCQNREFCSTGREAQLAVYEAVQIAVRGGKQIRYSKIYETGNRDPLLSRVRS